MFYRKNMRKNTRAEDAMLRWISRGLGADGLTGVCSGGGACSLVDGGAVRQASAPATSCGGGGMSSSLGAQCGLGEESERERESDEWHSGEVGDPPGPIYRCGWPANGAD